MDAFVDPTEEDFGNLFQKLSPDEFEKLEEILGSNIEATVDPKIEQTFSEQTLTFQGQNYNMEDNINIENIRRHLQQSPDYSFQEFLPSQQMRQQHQPHVKDELQWRITMHGQSNLQQHEQWLNQPISIKREVDENSNEYYNSSSYNSDVAVDISGDEAASTSISCKKRKTSSPSMSSSSSQLSGVDDERFPKDEDNRKERRREQNRRAATKCRLRKKASYDNLLKVVEKTQEENSQYKSEINKLKSVLFALQQTLKLHEPTCRLQILSNNLLGNKS